MGVFSFSFLPRNQNSSNKDLLSSLSNYVTILTKDFITQGFQSQHHNLFKKTKERRRGEKNQIPRTKSKEETKHIFENQDVLPITPNERGKKS